MVNGCKMFNMMYCTYGYTGAVMALLCLMQTGF